MILGIKDLQKLVKENKLVENLCEHFGFTHLLLRFLELGTILSSLESTTAVLRPHFGHFMFNPLCL